MMRSSRAGRRLIARARAAGVRFVAGTAWSASLPLQVEVYGDDAARCFRPQRLVVATGAFERPLPVPGWTLPGVMTTGAVQTLLRSYGVVPGRRILIAGNGPLNLQVASELRRAGAEIVLVAEAARRPGAWALGHLAAMATVSPGADGQGRRLSRSQRRFCPLGRATRRGGCRWRRSPRAIGRRLDLAGRHRRHGLWLPAGQRAAAPARLPTSLRSVSVGIWSRSATSIAAQPCRTCWLSATAAALVAPPRPRPKVRSPALSRPANGPTPTPLRQVARQRRFQRALWRMFAAPNIESCVCQCRNGDMPLRGGRAGDDRSGIVGRRQLARRAQARHPCRDGPLPGALLRTAAGGAAARAHWPCPG